MSYFYRNICFLLQNVKVDDRNAKGETARSLAMMYGYPKIVSLIDSRSPRIKPGNCFSAVQLIVFDFFFFFKVQLS